MRAFSVPRDTVLLVGGFVIGTALLRLPSFFEPAWHTDEGIFQAVAQGVARGGDLYADAWESKPPLFLYIHVGLLEVFGPGVLALRIATALAAVGAELATYGIALQFMGKRQALLAAGLLAVLLALPFWEGNLALSEPFAIFPSTLAVLVALMSGRNERWAVRGAIAAGLLFGLAFLIRQTTVVIGGSVVLWLLLVADPAQPRRAFLIVAASGLTVAAALAAFALFGSFEWFWNANVEFFVDYVPSGQQVPLFYRPLTLLAPVCAIVFGIISKRRKESPGPALTVLWLSSTLAAALLTGRPYSHYFLLVFPPLALTIAFMAPYISKGWRPARKHAPALALSASLAALWFGVVTPAFGGNLLAQHFTKDWEYYANFAGRVTGIKDDARYDEYFDKRIVRTERVVSALKRLGCAGESVYVWGEYPWIYPLSGSKPATPYMTSFYVLLIPYLDLKLKDELARADPKFIVKFNDAWPKLEDETGIMTQRYNYAVRGLEELLSEKYKLVAEFERAQIYQRSGTGSDVSEPVSRN